VFMWRHSAVPPIGKWIKFWIYYVICNRSLGHFLLSIVSALTKSEIDNSYLIKGLEWKLK